MKRVLILFAAVLFLGSCSSLKVSYDYDKTVDFTKFKTYSYLGWVKDSDKVINQLERDRIEKAFANEFDKRGIKFMKEGGELTVSLFIVFDKKTYTTAYTDNYGPGGYYYGYPWSWGMGYSTTTYQEHDYVLGTLVCDVFNASNKKLIWQGVGSKTVDDNPQTAEKRIPKNVAQIMARYPIPVIEENK